MHLPRYLEKIRRYYNGSLAEEYFPTLGNGFDALLCEYIRSVHKDMMVIVRDHHDDAELNGIFRSRFPDPLNPHIWNRLLVQRGLRGYSLERLRIRKEELGLTHRTDILTMCDLIEVNEGRLP